MLKTGYKVKGLIELQGWLQGWHSRTAAHGAKIWEALEWQRCLFFANFALKAVNVFNTTPLPWLLFL